jgi:dTDP-4-amino-4,6-dideoxygalactose transaminase
VQYTTPSLYISRNKQGDFPHAEKAAEEIMAIPVYPELMDEMKDFVADTIIDFVS